MGAVMEATDLTTKGRPGVSRRLAAASLIVIATILASQSVRAAEYEGGIQVGVSNTDNVFLATEPFTEDDNVLRASPFFSFEHRSPGLDATANYAFDWYRYTDLKQESSYHAYDITLVGKMLDESLSLLAGGTRRQVVRNPSESIPSGRLPLNGNLADQDELFVRPRFKRTFASAITVDASYRFAGTNYNDGAIQDNDNHEARFVLENYQRGNGLTWALRYERLKTDYEVSPEWEFQKASAELGFWLNAETRFFGSGGRESRWDDLEDRSPQDEFWEAGVALTKGPNFSAEIAAGERSFGSSWRGDLDFTFQRGSTTLSYNETPTTIGFGRDQLPDVIGDGDPVDFLTAPGRAERYILNRLQWSLELELRRTTVSLLVYDEERSGRIDVNGVTLSDQDQSGFSARMAWAFGRRSEIVAFGSFATRKFSALADSDLLRVGLSGNYRIGPSLALSLSYDYSDEQPNGAAGRDYAANVVSLLATYTFQSSL